MQLGRALTRAEASDPRFKGLGVRYGNGIYLKAGAVDPAAVPTPAAPTKSIAEMVAEEIAKLTPDQPDIPTFEASGLYSEADAGKSYDQYYGGYNQRQMATLEQEKQQAQDQFQRTLQSLGDSAAASEQTGSGADIRSRALADKGYKDAYENPLGSYQTRVQGTRDTQTLSRADHLQKLKDEAYKRYQSRFNNQATY